jgi:hypothetical protein
MNAIEPRGEPPEFLVDLNRQAGRLSLKSPLLFNSDRRGWGRSLVEKTALIPDVRSASIDLATATCMLQFDPGCDILSVSERFAEALRATPVPQPRKARSEPQWDARAAFMGNPSVMFWQARLLAPARLDLRLVPNPSNRLRLLMVVGHLSRMPGVTSCRVGIWPRRLLIEFDPSGLVVVDLLHESHRRWADADSLVEPSQTAPDLQSGVSGFRRIPYLALGGGCLLLTLAGLVLPGIPTVPFLVASSYFLARSSPRLHTHLHRLPLLGAVLHEWEKYRALRPESKSQLLTLSLGVLAFSAILDPLDPVAMGLTVLLGSLAVFGIRRIPVALPAPGEGDSMED